MSEPNPTITPLPGTDPELLRFFMSHVEITETCWLWRGATAGGRPGSRYGAFSIRRVQTGAHQAAYRLFRGTIPRGKLVCHTCDVTLCVNPMHLWIGTHKENMADCVAKNRIASGDRSYVRLHPESLKRGDDSWSRRHPERIARGASHWTRKHPESVLRGDSHPARTHPEWLPKGEAHKNSKLTEREVVEIRARASSGEPYSSIAKSLGIDRMTAWRIAKRRSWRHVP